MRKPLLLLTFLAAFLTCPCAFAWSEKDAMWESAYLAASLADGQEAVISSSGCSLDSAGLSALDGFSADLGCVNTAALTGLLIHAGISSILPSKYRRVFQQGSVSLDTQQREPVTRIAVSFAF